MKTNNPALPDLKFAISRNTAILEYVNSQIELLEARSAEYHTKVGRYSAEIQTTHNTAMSRPIKRQILNDLRLMKDEYAAAVATYTILLSNFYAIRKQITKTDNELNHYVTKG